MVKRSLLFFWSSLMAILDSFIWILVLFIFFPLSINFIKVRFKSSTFLFEFINLDFGLFNWNSLKGLVETAKIHMVWPFCIRYYRLKYLESYIWQLLYEQLGWIFQLFFFLEVYNQNHVKIYWISQYSSLKFLKDLNYLILTLLRPGRE